MRAPCTQFRRALNGAGRERLHARSACPDEALSLEAIPRRPEAAEPWEKKRRPPRPGSRSKWRGAWEAGATKDVPSRGARWERVFTALAKERTP